MKHLQNDDNWWNVSQFASIHAHIYYFLVIRRESRERPHLTSLGKMFCEYTLCSHANLGTVKQLSIFFFLGSTSLDAVLVANVSGKCAFGSAQIRVEATVEVKIKVLAEMNDLRSGVGQNLL